MRVGTRRLSLAFLLAFLAGAWPASGQDGVLIRYRLQAGQAFRSVNTTETEINQTFQGMEQQTRQTMTQRILMEVLSVDGDGAARVRYTTESVQVSMDTPMGRLTYDSSDPDTPAPQPLRAFSLMPGTTYTMTLAPDGSVRDVEGGEDTLDRMLEGMTLPPGMSADAMKEDLRAQYGDDAMARTMEQNFGGYPERRIPVGGSWSHTTRMGAIPLVVETTSTLVEHAGGVVKVATESTVTSDSTSVMSVGEMTQEYEVTGTSTGMTEIEEATGVALRSRMEMTMTGTMHISMGPQAMAVPMVSRMVMTSERLPGG